VAESVEERAMVALVEVLGGMTGERQWGGRYPNDPVVHRDELHNPEQVMQAPHICIEEDLGTELEDENGEVMATVGAELAIHEKFRVVLYGHVQATADVTAGMWRRRLRHDIRTTLLADMTLGGIARGIQFDAEEVDGGILQPKALLVMPLAVLLDQTFEVG
jgi:hypothetical protein